MGLATLVGLAVFDTFERKTVVEEHGFIAGNAHATYNDQWSRMAMNLTSILKEKVGKKLETELIESICNEGERIIGPLIGTRRPKWNRESKCQPRSEEQKHFIYRRLKEERKKNHMSQSVHPMSQSVHPMLMNLNQILSEPFLVNIRDQWLGPDEGSGPIQKITPYPNMITKEFQLKDTVVHNSSFFDHQIATVVPASRGDSRDLFVIMFLFDWDNPSQYSVGGLAISFARFLSTVPWNSRDIIIVITDNKSPYAASKYSDIF